MTHITNYEYDGIVKHAEWIHEQKLARWNEMTTREKVWEMLRENQGIRWRNLSYYGHMSVTRAEWTYWCKKFVKEGVAREKYHERGYFKYYTYFVVQPIGEIPS